MFLNISFWEISIHDIVADCYCRHSQSISWYNFSFPQLEQVDVKVLNIGVP